MMHEHDFDLIASHLMGLADASASMEACSTCRREFDAQLAVRAELASLDRPALTEIERHRLARAVRAASEPAHRFSRVNWAAWGTAAASLVLMVGFAGMFANSGDDDLVFEAASEPIAADSEGLFGETDVLEGLGAGPTGDRALRYTEGIPPDFGEAQGSAESIFLASGTELLETLNGWMTTDLSATSNTSSQSADPCDSQVSGVILIRLTAEVEGTRLLGYLVETSTGRKVVILTSDRCEPYHPPASIAD